MTTLESLRTAASQTFPGLVSSDDPRMDVWRAATDAVDAFLMALPGADAMVEAVRSHPLVGRGSCSTVDECLTAPELMDILQEAGATTPEAAVNVALDFEGLKLEQATNCRWGADDDDELKNLEEFEAARRSV